MEDKLALEDASNTLRERMFFAARDGMSLTLYALLYEKNTDEIDELLNTVSIGICLVIYQVRSIENHNFS